MTCLLLCHMLQLLSHVIVVLICIQVHVLVKPDGWEINAMKVSHSY